MNTTIYSLLIAVTCSVTAMPSASANTTLSADKYTGMHKESRTHRETLTNNETLTHKETLTNNETPAHKETSMNNETPMNNETLIFKGEPTFKGSENFVKSFPNAMIESCETKGDMTKVKFSWNGDALEAYYNATGTLLATTHYVNPKALPMSIQMKIKEKYEDYWIFQALELYHVEDGLKYYIIIKKADKALVLQVDPDGSTSVMKKLKN